MAMVTVPIAFARNRADDVFFPAMALLILAVAVAGFGDSYFFAGMFAAKLPTPLVHIHAGLFSCWIAMLAVQPLLVAANRVDWHVKVGTAGMVLAAALPLVAIATLIGQLRRHGSSHPELSFTFSLVAAADFAVLVFLGLRERRMDLSAHKRLMLLATVSMLGPAIGRLPLPFGLVGYYGVFAAFAVIFGAFDLLTIGRIHRATVLCVLVIAASQASAEFAWRTEAAHRVVTWIGGPNPRG